MSGPVEGALAPALKVGLASIPEWRSACVGQHSMLLEGAEDSTEGILTLLTPHLYQPFVWSHAQMPFTSPPGDCATLVLRDVGALARHQQVGLLEWLDDPNDRKQVVSTSVRPLFPLVGSGLFDESLYYRLNVILLRI